MNRFRTKRRAKDDAAAAPPPRMPAEAETSRFRLFGHKKPHGEVKKEEFDLANALPKSDDFRTSLLMNGLSARFSMLREQDDPNTKIGKASDDSVLYPKRQSRMGMGMGMSTGMGGLGDIAEVESIKASFGRMDSYHSDDADSTKGGVMSRGKPTEGNNLFGGRQKIYKIPTGAQSNGGGLGKAVYEDDVSLSAFQKWKQAERERHAAFDRDGLRHLDLSTSREREIRPESPPPLGYNHRRETNSTTSSAPSGARNSTAATSITSQQPTPSTKDWIGAHGAPSPTPGFEKNPNVARTRRLYETGLSQELHEQQSQALSKIDTLSQRLRTTKTPDLSQNTPSPTTNFLFSERPVDRRLLTKASAPNLHTPSSPPASASTSHPPMDLGIKLNGMQENKGYGAAPPLSPPISENEDPPLLSIHPNDKGKATALGVFQKPAQPYDESTYAQRQIQLSQGRDTPTQRFRAESNASRDTGRSGSASSAQRKPFEPLSIKTEFPSKNQSRNPYAFFDDEEEQAPQDQTAGQAPITRQIPAAAPAQARPSDQEHPAFRTSALPTPLSFTSKVSDEPSPLMAKPDIPHPANDFVDDSPTLGPGAGLSGMVRQHLRSDSNASSVYADQTNHRSVVAPKLPSDPFDSKTLDDLGVKSNPWDAPDWTLSYYGNEDKPNKLESQKFHSPLLPPVRNSEETDTGTNSEVEKDHDDFHHQLADGARRVRERLTSYVESDLTSLGPLPTDPAIQSPESAKHSPLSILRHKSSRGSLIDRNRDNTKNIKKLGLGQSTISSAPSPIKGPEERDPLSPMQEEFEKEEEAGTSRVEDHDHGHEKEEDSGEAAGLRKFRQARRELQKLREIETQRRHQGQATPVDRSTVYGAPRHRTPSGERRPPPVLYQRRDHSEESSQAGSRAASRPPSRAERDRSGSETSSESRNGSRPPPRIRNTIYDGPHIPPGASNPPRQGRPMIRSPGLPGTNIKQSPIMPPQGYPSAMSPGRFDRSASGQNLSVSNQRHLHSGQPSPISPMGDLPSPFGQGPGSGATTPRDGYPHSPRRPSAPPTPNPEITTGAGIGGLDPSARRHIRKKDISEPTFISTTSRVPTVDLPEQQTGRSRSASRARSGSLLQSLTGALSTPNLHSQANAHAPPLPPLNPKRRNVLGNLMGRKEDEDFNLSAPTLPFAPTKTVDQDDDNRSAFSVSDDEEPTQRRRLRKVTSEVNVRAGARRTRYSPTYGDGAPSPMATPSQLPGGMI